MISSSRAIAGYHFYIKQTSLDMTSKVYRVYLMHFRRCSGTYPLHSPLLNTETSSTSVIQDTTMTIQYKLGAHRYHKEPLRH